MWIALWSIRENGIWNAIWNLLVIKRLLKVIAYTCTKENVCFFWKQVISSKNNNGNPELELYPITVKLLRHQIVAQRPTPTSFTGVMSGIGGMALSKFYICSKKLSLQRHFIDSDFSKMYNVFSAWNTCLWVLRQCLYIS